MINEINVNVKKIKEEAHIPFYATEEAAGADLYAVLEESVTIKPNETFLVPTGLTFEFPKGIVGLVYARSGLASKKGLAPANKVGVVDSDYRGEVMVALHNHSAIEQTIENGERVAQFVIMPYFKANYKEVEDINETDRGTGGFGSSGIK
ncbi:MAG: dUTP diphosphatase [Bacilli bacterium]|nr:dUTP diphosphatase [Bacilli bacterium]